MTKTTVILLGHKSLSGKDTFFEAVKDYGFVRAAFADKLKENVADLYRFSHEQMYGELKDIPDERYPNTVDEQFIKVKGSSVRPRQEGPQFRPEVEIENPFYYPFLTPRRILQVYGQQQRAIYEDVWAAYVFDSTIPKLIEQGHNKIIITDFRFKNEGAYATKWTTTGEGIDVHCVKIYRPGVQAKSGANDISEVDLDDYYFDFTIQNDGTLEEFQEKAREFVSGL